MQRGVHVPSRQGRETFPTLPKVSDQITFSGKKKEKSRREKNLWTIKGTSIDISEVLQDQEPLKFECFYAFYIIFLFIYLFWKITVYLNYTKENLSLLLLLIIANLN